MDQFKKWAQKEYPLVQRLLALIPAGFLFVILIPYILVRLLPALDQKLGLPSYTFGIPTIIAGSLMVVVGLIYALWSISDQLFRARGTPIPVMATQKLLVTGPFKQCRNPMTFGTIFLYLGISIFVGSLSAVVIVLLFTGMLVTYIRLVEEKELEARFGDEYVVYKNQTPFIIPKIFTRRS